MYDCNGEEEIKDIIDRYIGYLPKDSTAKAYASYEVDLFSDIVRNAKNKFGFRSTGEVIGLIDTSLTKTGKAGFLFTTEGLAFDYAFEKVFLRYDEINSLSFNKRGSELYFNGSFYGINSSTTIPSISNTWIRVSELKEMIEEIMGLFHK